MGGHVSTGLGSIQTQEAVSSKGYSNLVSGGRITTAAAKQGDNQCVSTYKVPPDTPTAMCQAFCNVKFKKFHCMWCKCRACTFCPKGGDAIDEAARDASPPPPDTAYGEQASNLASGSNMKVVPTTGSLANSEGSVAPSAVTNSSSNMGSIPTAGKAALTTADNTESSTMLSTSAPSNTDAADKAADIELALDTIQAQEQGDNTANTSASQQSLEAGSDIAHAKSGEPSMTEPSAAISSAADTITAVVPTTDAVHDDVIDAAQPNPESETALT